MRRGVIRASATLSSTRRRRLFIVETPLYVQRSSADQIHAAVCVWAITVLYIALLSLLLLVFPFLLALPPHRSQLLHSWKTLKLLCRVAWRRVCCINWTTLRAHKSSQQDIFIHRRGSRSIDTEKQELSSS